VSVEVPSVAVIVIVSPFVPPAERVSVVSDVTSSLDDVPVSDAAARSTAGGTSGAVVSTVTDGPFAAAPGPTTPDDAVTLPAVRVGTTVPSEQPLIVTVKVLAAPDDGETGVTVIVQPVAPAMSMSCPVNVEVSTGPVKVTEYVRVAEFVGDVVEVVNDDTANAVYRIITTPSPPSPATVYSVNPPPSPPPPAPPPPP